MKTVLKISGVALFFVASFINFQLQESKTSKDVSLSIVEKVAFGEVPSYCAGGITICYVSATSCYYGMIA